MTSSRSPGIPIDPQVLILASGEFGNKVARRLASDYSCTILDVERGTHPSLWPRTDLIVLATDAERPWLSHAIDRTAFVRSIPWFPVYPRATDLHCGPVVIPGQTACYWCFERRRKQHGRSSGQSSPDAAPPSGYPLYEVGICVGLARQAISEAFEGPVSRTLGGTVRMFNVISGTLNMMPVVAVDRCQRCRGRFGSDEAERHELWRRLQAVTEGVQLLSTTAQRSTAEVAAS